MAVLGAVSDFAIRTFEFPYSIPETSETGIARQADFVIDGVPLSQTLNIWPDRPWFGRTRFELPRGTVARYIEELLGLRTPHHEHGSGRVALYGCHCGSDACGLISCALRREGNIVHWENIGWENDDDVEHTRYRRLAGLAFDYTQYARAVHDYAWMLIEPKRLPELAGHSWAPAA